MGIILLRRCVKMHTAIELTFGVVSGVGPGIRVFHLPRREGALSGMVFGIFRKFGYIDFNGDMVY